jgi:hypothetical protein
VSATPKVELQVIALGCSVAPKVIGSSSNGGSMARKRYQRGFVYLDGDKGKGRYREDLITEDGTKRVRREVILGSKRE